MKVTVITIAFNAEDTIDETIQSVLEQDYPDIEYIIIDGASSDGTNDIIAGYAHRISKYISEPDLGIYDAMNKGLRMATGELVALLNADDTYSDAHVLSTVVGTISRENTDACYGDLEYVSRTQTDRVVRKWISGPYRKKSFKQGWMPPHPAFFVKRAVYEKYGLFNTRFRTSADYELMLRFLYRHEVSVCYLPKVLVKMKTGGQSNQSVKNRIIANREDRQAWIVNGLRPGRLTFIMKPIRKISQFWRR